MSYQQLDLHVVGFAIYMDCTNYQKSPKLALASFYGKFSWYFFFTCREGCHPASANLSDMKMQNVCLMSGDRLRH